MGRCIRGYEPMKKKFPIHPANPERLCWGCDKYCAADNMLCGNGSDRTQHPCELWGDDWQAWGSDFMEQAVEGVTLADDAATSSALPVGPVA